MATRKSASKAAGTKRAGAKRAGTKRAGTKRAGTKRAGTKRAGTKRAGTKRAGTKRAAAKRTRLVPKGDARFVRRDARGRIKESDDVGRSLTTDRKRAAKTAAKRGQGDKGDRRR